MSTLSLALIVCFALVAAVTLWRAERRRIAEQTRRTVMASVMDAQNNFLTNMVYFRTRAELGGLVTKGELNQMDEAIRDAQHRLNEIAESDIARTRDLGGIRVLVRPRTTLAS